MGRTLRIKLFKFSELNVAAQATAIKEYRKQVGDNKMNLYAIVSYFDTNKYEFTKEGHHFITPTKKEDGNKSSNSEIH